VRNVSFDRVVLIFNPKSTGQAQKQAEDLRRDLGQRVPMLAADLVPTEHAGHATELSRTPAGAGSPLVVSVSGDGGYNEVVNGVMQAGNDRAASAVLAAGTPTTTGAPRGNCRLRRRSLRAPSAALTCSASPQAARPTMSSDTPTRTSGWG